MSRRHGTEDFRGSLLEYASSEINTHASMIIGFSVVLFAYLDLALVRFFQPVPHFQFRFPNSITEWQCLFLSVVLALIVWVLVFVTFRLAFYGLITHKTLTYEKSVISFADLWHKITNEEIINDRFVRIVPARWFSAGFGGNASLPGLLLSLGISILVCLVLSFTLFWTL